MTTAAETKSTALEIYTQYQKIRQLKSKLWKEERKLNSMAGAVGYLSEKITVKGDVLQVQVSQRYNSADVQVEKIGSIKDLQALIQSAQ
jgi:hypothetical protein